MKEIYVSVKCNKALFDFITKEGYEVNCIPKNNFVYDEISYHADIQYIRIDDGFVFQGNPCKLGSSYPYSAIYTGVCTKKYFIHNLKVTEKSLLQEIRKRNIKQIHVNQAYTKCNMVVVNDTSFITSDMGIYKALENIIDIDILLIKEGYVNLPGFNYGFLGGASGKVGEYVVFNGNLEEHPNYLDILNFIESKGLKVKYFKEYPLEDIGSIV